MGEEYSFVDRTDDQLVFEVEVVGFHGCCFVEIHAIAESCK